MNADLNDVWDNLGELEFIVNRDEVRAFCEDYIVKSDDNFESRSCRKVCVVVVYIKLCGAYVNDRLCDNLPIKLKCCI